MWDGTGIPAASSKVGGRSIRLTNWRRLVVKGGEEGFCFGAEGGVGFGLREEGLAVAGG